MNKAYVYRLYPTDEQRMIFAKTFGCCRKVWNLMLSDKIDYYKKTGQMLRNTPAQYKTDYPYLKEVDSLALANVQLALQRAYKAFFDLPSVGFPKFKSKRRSALSYTTNNQNGTVKVSERYIRLPKVGLVQAKIHRNAPSGWKLKSAAISCDKCGRYYVSVLYEYEDTARPIEVDPAKILGLDYKSDGLYVDSNGDCAKMPHYYRQSQKKLKRLQRKLKNKTGAKKGERPSRNFDKALAKVRKQHAHVSNQRKDYLHKQSKTLADDYDLIGVEDLSLKVMSSEKGLKLGKATADNGYGMFLQMLSYKMSDRGKWLIKVSRTFPSSQLCQCGYKNPITKDLSVRKIICPVCGRIYDRDINAAVNIKNEAYRIYRCGTPQNVGQELPKLRPVEPAPAGLPDIRSASSLAVKQEARQLVAG